MLVNLNEKYLLKYISNPESMTSLHKNELIELMGSLGIKIKFDSQNPVYDLIDRLEYGGIYYE